MMLKGEAMEAASKPHFTHNRAPVQTLCFGQSSGEFAIWPDRRNQKRLYQSARSGANGKFEFRGVAPSSYSLFSWDNVDEDEWDDPEFLNPFQSKAVPVRVAEGETKTADLTVIRTKSEEDPKP